VAGRENHTLDLAVTDPQHIHEEMDHAYATFHQLTRNTSRSDLHRPSEGTRWTNQQLLFHMMFGYLIVRRLLPLVRFFGRLPDWASRGFAAVLNAATPPFHFVNYLGSWAGGTVVSPIRTERLLKRTIEALHGELGGEDEASLRRTMHFPVGWDPYFKDTMTLADVYHYGTQHFDHHRAQLTIGRDVPAGTGVAKRNRRRGPHAMTRPSPPVLLLRKIVQRLGLHPDDQDQLEVDLTGRRALVIATNHSALDIGKPTGVFASELTAAYYAFLDAGMQVDVASQAGGMIPVEPLSVNPIIRTAADDRFLADPVLRAKINDSLPIASVDIDAYDIVYLAGGWGAAFDLGFSDALAAKTTDANAAGLIIGGVCHGPLGLINATGADGTPLVEGRRVTGVSNRQVRDLRITDTPQHPETELRRKGAQYESSTRICDVLANHWAVDGNLVTGQNQNAGPMVAREMLRLAEQRLEEAAPPHRQ
jgi:putative intracellular protease/amidase